jgi:FkbM family methyltransferase
MNKRRRELGLRASLQGIFIAIRTRLNPAQPEPAEWWVRPPDVDHPLKFRLRGSSDMLVFDQIFMDDGYLRLCGLKDVSLILDLGANTGISAAYFLSNFPKARVVAVEPDSDNLKLCKANLAPYGDRVLLLHGAVWDECTTLRLIKGKMEWGTEVAKPVEGTVGDVQAWDMQHLIEMGGGGTVDLLKIDIECAERMLFGNPPLEWLPRVRNLCIELHNAECEEVFFRAMADFDYELENGVDCIICWNIRQKAPPPTPKCADTPTRGEE